MSLQIIPLASMHVPLVAEPWCYIRQVPIGAHYMPGVVARGDEVSIYVLADPEAGLIGTTFHLLFEGQPLPTQLTEYRDHPHYLGHAVLPDGRVVHVFREK